MKLNKPTMEYIHTLIRTKANEKVAIIEKEIEAVKAPYVKRHDKFKQEIELVRAEAQEQIEKLVKKYGHTNSRIWGWMDRRITLYKYDDVGCNFPKEIEEKVSELNSKMYAIENKVLPKYNEIIAKMTLGGDAADLAKLIDEIEF